ncbi:MAG: amidohydrolase [Bacteroidota bacterium]
MHESLLNLRHELHCFPELSGNEQQTARRIVKFLKPLEPDHIIEKIGGYGVLAVFDSGQSGPVVLFRADTDALPIAEMNGTDYCSRQPGISHKCGHDGHSAILAGLAAHISSKRPGKGKFLLLFQPAEETGVGAQAVLSDQAFSSFNPDYCFALHNLPGYARSAVIVRNGTFAAASCGMIIRLKGRSSHASEPEKGKSPASAMAQLMANLPKLSGSGPDSGFTDFALLTLIYGSLGTPAFGTSPGEAVLMATLRAYLDSDMKILSDKVTAMVKQHAEPAHLSFSISYTEEFPAMMNHPEAVGYVIETAAGMGFPVVEAGLPFRWSEDFAHFALKSKAALFGIGAGISHPPLHDPDYDFPDRIIATGVSIWQKLYERFAF